MPIHGTSRYKQVEPGKNVSHLTRVNSTSNSSKTIVPKKIIEALNLRYDDDYLEWRMEMRGGRKVAIVEVNRISSGEKGIWSQHIETRLETPVLCHDHIPDAWSNFAPLHDAQYGI